MADCNLYLERSENKLILARTVFDLSTSSEAREALGIPDDKTFFNDVISDSYYSIFYGAKALLLNRNIKTSPPEEHKKTYEEFKRLSEEVSFERRLMEIYEEESVKAETLLDIFFTERRKRGIFTYNVRSDANIPFAIESLKNAQTFLSAMKEIIKRI